MASRTLRVVISGDASKLHAALGQSQSKLSKFGAVAGLAGGAVAAGLGAAVKSAMGFEKQMSSLEAVTNSTGRQMEQFRKQALQAGADTAFSAKEAALAQTELAKGGLSVANIMSGGLSAALSLAAAGELELGEAAATTANAMNLFGLRGSEAGRVADALATAANATTADVSDFGMALKQSGAVAKSAGLSFEETVVALEALAASGVKNSDAGTSLKTALIQLIKPTNTQADMAKKLGLTFIDAQGNMKSLGDISGMLRERLEGMGKAQRTATLATLAGTDGVRTLTALYDAGPEKLARWEEGVSKSGTAAQVAKTKQDNLAGAVEQFQGSLETLSIIVGTAVLPALTSGTRAITTFLNQMQSGSGAGGRFVSVLNAIKDAVVGVYSWFDRHKTATTALMAAIAATTAALVTYKAGVKAVAVAQGIATFATTGWVTAFWALNTAMRANPIGLVVTALAALAAAFVVAWKRSDKFRDVVSGAMRGVVWIVDKALGGFSSLFSAIGHAPGMGWAKDAAKAIDSARRATREWAEGLNKLPKEKRIRLTIVEKSMAGAVKGLIGDGPGGAFKGNLMGAGKHLAPFAASGARYGVRVVSGLRKGAITSTGNRSNHASGNAIDLAGTPASMKRFFNHARSAWGSRLAELIYTPGGVGIKNGRPHRYTGKVAKDHYDHVHLAYTGGIQGDGPGHSASLAYKAGLRGQALTTAVAIAGAESGWRTGASNRNSDGSIDRGMWQINSVHGAMSTFSPTGNAAAMARISRGGKNWSPWVAYTSGAYRRHLGAARAAVGAMGGTGGREAIERRLERNQDRLDRLRNQLTQLPTGKAGAASRKSIQRQIRSLVSANRNLRGDLRDAPTAADIREGQEKAGSRLVNRIVAPFMRDKSGYEGDIGRLGVRSLGTLATGLGSEIEGAATQYGQAERFFGQSEEDLGTAAGRQRRISEIAALKQLKRQQLERQQKRAAALAKAISMTEQMLRKLRAARNKTKGAKRAKINARIKTYDDRLTDLKAELLALGYAITDTQLDLGDLDKEARDVAATPDTVPEAGPSTLDKLGYNLDVTGLRERAGVITPEQARAERISQLEQALRGEFGALTENERLQVMGDLREAQQQSAEAAKALTEAICELKASMDATLAFSKSVAETELYQMTKSLADIISGQIAGFGVAGRGLVPGSGALARY